MIKICSNCLFFVQSQQLSHLLRIKISEVQCRMRSAIIGQCTAFSMVDDICYRGMQEGKVLDLFKNIRVDVLESIRMTLSGRESFFMRTGYWRKRCMQVLKYAWFKTGGSAASCTVAPHLLAMHASHLLAMHAFHIMAVRTSRSLAAHVRFCILFQQKLKKEKRIYIMSYISYTI